MTNWQNATCYRCCGTIKLGREWSRHYFYCPTCREERTEKGAACKS